MPDERHRLKLQREAKRLREMKVGFVERVHLDVFHGKRIRGTRCNDNIVAILRCMRQNVCEAVENSFAELHDVMTTSGCAEVLNHVLSEVGREHEGVVASRTHEQIIACGTMKRIPAFSA